MLLSPLCGSVPTMGDGQAGLDAPSGYTALTWPGPPGWQGEGLPAARVCLWFPLEKWGFGGMTGDSQEEIAIVLSASLIV